MAIEHQTRMTNIEDTQNMQLGIESSNASLAMIKKLKNSIDVVNKTTELLQELKNTVNFITDNRVSYMFQCEDKDQDYHATAIKAIKYYTGEIEMAKSKFDFQIQQLKSNMYDEREADPRVVDGCLVSF